MKRLTMGLVVLALVASVAGCGGDGDEGGESGTQGGTPTKAEYIAQADAICVEATAEIEAGYADFLEAEGIAAGKPEQAQLVAAVEEVLVPGLRQRLEELRELEQPEGDAAELEAFFEASEAGIEDVEAAPERMLGGSEYPFVEAAKLAKSYGLVECRKT